MEGIRSKLIGASAQNRDAELKAISRVNLEIETLTALRQIELDLEKALLAIGPDVNGSYEEQAQKLRDLAAAQKAALPDVLAARANAKLLNDINKANADEITEFWKQAAHSMQSSMSNFFFDAMQGNLKDLAGSFKRTIDRMVADVLAAKAATALFGNDFGKGGNIGGYVGAAMSAFGFGGGTQYGDLVKANPIFGSAMSLDSFATGTDYVPKTGMYTLHQGEAVTPASENKKGGNTIIIQQTLNGSPSRQSISQSAAETGQKVNRALDRYT